MGGEIAATATLEVHPERTRFLGVFFDCLEQWQVIDKMRLCRSDDGFSYVVTPNVDHIVRLAAQPATLTQYNQASLCLCDSKPLQVLSHTVGRPLTHVTGSDLTKAIFDSLLEAGDVVTLIVAREEIASKLMARFPEVTFHWHVPPFGVLDKPDALCAAVDFIVDHPARFIFIAIGSPQSEVIAAKTRASGQAHGTALCVGASLEFITGDRARAPAWMNRSGMEWLHRIATEPRRLWKRYVYSVPPLLRLYWLELMGPKGP
ncbi:MAG: WecB/TagA/CpsF family glycosyltransferase [Candidatus Devosia phytovorans]|uniref:WecB/TagA/CpsF family glycosyltransferase n=1 Tax=Candidatus Devosia phytovorans TaxID=3121372 RepID=A0AAJ6AZ42_9HYPH|nr:WecB/TagA/CpsF family glycosyltransferase [Devosia sp.]WEK03712.1 MAG: WecB/TagA/CpsF family glycosyltransferase [Devosia sp.]